MKRLFLATLALVALFVTPAFALDLLTAKEKGLVGETMAGLIAPVTTPVSPDVQTLITTTNAGRMKIYADTARTQKVPIEQVQAVSGATLIEKTPKGQFVKTANGWVRK
jgi:hypothetical protein